MELEIIVFDEGGKFLVCNFFCFEWREIDDEDDNNTDVTFNFLNK